jgi:hypothetical protein
VLESHNSNFSRLTAGYSTSISRRPQRVMPASTHGHHPPNRRNPLATTWTSIRMPGLVTVATRMDGSDSAKRAAEIHHEDLAGVIERTHSYSNILMYNTQFTIRHDSGRISSKTDQHAYWKSKSDHDHSKPHNDISYQATSTSNGIEDTWLSSFSLVFTDATCALNPIHIMTMRSLITIWVCASNSPA